MDELQIIYLATNELTPYEGNARHHSHDDIESIKASIREFGFCDPIGVWGKKNIIVEGHGRLIAAEELGLTEVPCIRLDDLTDGQRRAYALAHNKTAELSNWDFSKLEAALREATIDFSFDMEAFGFEVPDIELFYEPENKEKQTAKATPKYHEYSAPQNNYRAYQNEYEPAENKEYQKPLVRQEQEYVTKEELDQYAERAEEILGRKRIIITYRVEHEEELKRRLGIGNGKIHNVYDFEVLFKLE